MLRKVFVGGSFLCLLCLPGCGSDVGNDGAKVGGDCDVGSDCSILARCLTGAAWPGGYCATACESGEDCPGGSVCADTDMGICVVACAGDGECRRDDGHTCNEYPARNAAGTVMGCGFGE